jgi:hypothetical protein
MTPREWQRGSECPDADALGTPHSPEVQAHLAACPACRAESELLHSFEEARPGNAERADLDWMESRLRTLRPGLPPARRWWQWPPVSRVALAGLTLVAAVAIGLQWRNARVQPLDGPGNAPVLRSSGSLEWIGGPAGDLPRLPDRLEWTPVEGATYSVQLLEVDGTVVWESAPLREPRLTVPAEAGARTGPLRSFSFRVTARDETGRVVSESPRATFRIAPNARP